MGYQKIEDPTPSPSHIEVPECLDIRSDCRQVGNGYCICYKWSVIFSFALIPIWLIIGLPMIIFGMRETSSPFLSIPFCATNTGQFISMNLSTEFPQCPPKENLTIFDAQNISFEFRKMRSDVGFQIIFLRYKNDPYSTANITISVERKNATRLNMSNITLSPMIGFISNQSIIHSNIQNYNTNGEITQYTYLSLNSNCYDPYEGCKIYVPQLLAKDSFSNFLQFNQPINGARINISVVMEYESNDTPALWLGFVETSASVLFIFGIIITLIPIVVLCAPVLYVLSLFASCVNGCK